VQIIVLSALMIFLPLITAGLIDMWREYRYKKQMERGDPENAWNGFFPRNRRKNGGGGRPGRL